MLLVALWETGLIRLEDPGSHTGGVKSPLAGPAPLPGPGLGLATPLAPLSRGSGLCTWVTTLGPAAAILPGDTSLCAGPDPLPGPGLGLATALVPPARGLGCCTWVTTLGPKRARRGRSSLPEAAF